MFPFLPPRQSQTRSDTLYRLPQDIDLSFLVGADLLQVCVGSNEVILNFSDDIRITMLSEFLIREPGGEQKSCREVGDGVLFLIGRLNEVITTAHRTNDGGLKIVFSSEAVLEISDQSDEFESFWINHRDKQIIA